MGCIFSFLNPKSSTSSRANGGSRTPRNSNLVRNGAAPLETTLSKSETSKKQQKKYGYIPDNFTSLEQVFCLFGFALILPVKLGDCSVLLTKTWFLCLVSCWIMLVSEALRKAGLESSNLIVGIDFTKSNEWTGKVSFNNHSLHAIGDTPNPYEKAISIIGKTLAPFDEDNLIPCFGFGDATTHDETVFSFHSDHSPCHGFEDVLSCYRRIVPNLRLSGPTSYAPVVEAAIDIVEKSGGQYHVLVIIADGQVTRSVNTSDSELSPQEEKTIKSFVDASSYPLSIILVGVGDGPWENMRNFDDKIPARDFDNFQFVNFTYIMSKSTSPAEKEAAFSLAALMEIPIQYKAALEFRLLGRVTGKAKKIVPRPPPVPYTYRVPPTREPSHLSGDTQTTEEQSQTVCPICLTNGKDLAFNCGHMTCRECGTRVSLCPICRQPINSRLRVYTG